MRFAIREAAYAKGRLSLNLSPRKHFPGWNQKCFKTVLWKLPGLTFWAGARDAMKHSSGSFLGSLSGLGPEML